MSKSCDIGGKIISDEDSPSSRKSVFEEMFLRIKNHDQTRINNRDFRQNRSRNI